MKKELTLFDNPRNVKRLLTAFYCVLGFLVVIDFWIPKHPSFPWDGQANFYSVYGFLAYVGIILTAKVLRRFLKREETYYDDQSQTEKRSQ